MNYIARGCMYCEGICNKECLPKKETVEEAAEYHVKMQYPMGVEKEYPINDFIQGAKWQQERMYSEEEVRRAFQDGQDNMDYSEMYGWSSKLTEQKWFNQFKKK